MTMTQCGNRRGLPEAIRGVLYSDYRPTSDRPALQLDLVIYIFYIYLHRDNGTLKVMENKLPRLIGTLPRSRCRLARPTTHLRHNSTWASTSESWKKPPVWTNVAEDEIARLAALRRRPLTLADLLKWVNFPTWCVIEIADDIQTWPTSIIQTGSSRLGQFHSFPSSGPSGLSHTMFEKFTVHRCFQPPRFANLQQLPAFVIDLIALPTTPNHHPRRRETIRRSDGGSCPNPHQYHTHTSKRVSRMQKVH